ncbi:hypothetical protein RR42_s1287 [Cupriavidus basilensis]|uniref:Uncharacterized protein n=1 Tax=Cupriavidus basilensis TaxID=68895 RepID=A0A0C4YJU3_9BURK|nr:hypothetical protein RR42_s1287 [Cupriavidus basilensis]
MFGWAALPALPWQRTFHLAHALALPHPSRAFAAITQSP